MINILSPINQLGYGITGLNIVKSLNSITDVSLWCIGQPQVTNQSDADTIRLCLNRAQFYDFNAPCIKIWHQHDMAQFVGKGEHIGFPIFELDRFNDLELHHLKSLDKIFVCSEWAKRVVLSNIHINANRVNVIPLGVDMTIFKPTEQPDSPTTKFLNCGKWEIRKGHDILVKAFNKAFGKDDNVELLMMCENPFCSESEQKEWINLYKKSKLGDKINILERKSSQEQVYNIMASCHCGVFPARAEGWNLELLEMMSCGKQVITTNYSAHTQFCNKDNSYLVDIEDSEQAFDGKWFHGQGNWAKISEKNIDTMAEYLIEIHRQRIHGTLKQNVAGINTAQKFTWENSAKEIVNVLNLV